MKKTKENKKSIDAVCKICSKQFSYYKSGHKGNFCSLKCHFDNKRMKKLPSEIKIETPRSMCPIERMIACVNDAIKKVRLWIQR